MSKSLSAIIKKIEKDYKKRFVKDIKIFLKKKKIKSDNIVLNVYKNLSENEKQKLAAHRKIIIE